MQRHSISPQAILKIAQQVQAPLDFDKPYRIVITVKGSEVHVAASNNVQAVPSKCFECARYEDLLVERKAVRLLTEEDDE